MKYPFVSIIIPVEEFNKYLEESLPKYAELDYPNFEVLVFTTKSCDKKFPKVRFMSFPDLAKNPSKKRDLALKYAKGDWWAFIDDDAFPDTGWLKNASKHFSNKEIVAVGGVQLTPDNSDKLEKILGFVSASLLGGGSASYRFWKRKKRFVDDHPSVSLVVRAGDFRKVDGFNSNFYPGEDTKLCLDLTKNPKNKIIYDPSVVVYHHRRSSLIKHLKQNGNYGLHRGFFARIYPQTSFRLAYFIPSFFVLSIVFWILSYFWFPTLFALYSLVFDLYLLLLVATSVWVYLQERDILVSVATAPAIFLTHFWYGVRFIQGFVFTRRLER